MNANFVWYVTRVYEMKAVWKYKSYGAPMGLGFFYEVSSEFGRWIVHAIPSINFRSRTLLISLDKRPKRTDKGKIVSDENAKDLRVFTGPKWRTDEPTERGANRPTDGPTDFFASDFFSSERCKIHLHFYPRESWRIFTMVLELTSQVCTYNGKSREASC